VVSGVVSGAVSFRVGGCGGRRGARVGAAAGGLWFVGAGFDDGVDPSNARDGIEHFCAGDVHDRGVRLDLDLDLDVERLGLGLGGDGDGDPSRGGVPDDLGCVHHDDVVAGVGRGQRPCVGCAAGESGRLQRLDRRVDAGGPDCRLDVHGKLRS
jgi:hypothetical protein